jgi:hypothetical protein
MEKTIPIGGTVTYRIDVGRDGGAAMDCKNRLWLGDCRYSPEIGYGSLDSGNSTNTDAVISGTPDQKLYQTSRWSPDFIGYRFDTYQPGDYLVRLMFAETFFGTKSFPGPSLGLRVMDGTINGKPALTGFDIIKEAGGSNAAVDRSFILHIDKPDPIIVRLTATANNPTLSGIEVRVAQPGDTSAAQLP